MTDDTEGGFPISVLEIALWAFHDGEQFSDPVEFDRRVHEYHTRGGDEDTWDPDEIIPLARLRMKYFGLESPDDDEYSDLVADLEAGNGTHFTAGELLLKLNNAVAPHLDGVDHRYFEGLYLTDDPPVDGVPVYEMMQGS